MQSTTGFSKERKALFLLTYCLILTVLFIAGAELILRLRGVKPWRKEDIPVQVRPGGKFFQKHPALGFTHIPGRFTVTLATGYSFNVTHLPNSLRITHPIGTYGSPKEKEEIWIFGCSLTHGWSLNDEETYSWLLQERLPEYEVVNFGVNGYGTIHSLIQLREALQLRTPKVVVLVYAGIHDVRNTNLRIRRKTIAPWNKLGPLVQPYARLDKEGRLQYFVEDLEYREWPLMGHLALVHFLEMKYNELEPRLYRSHAVTETLILEMAGLAKKHGAKFIVANITGGTGMREFSEKNRIPVVDISVDLKIRANTNYPHDGHPSARANKQYADKLEAFLRAGFLKDGGRSGGTPVEP